MVLQGDKMMLTLKEAIEIAKKNIPENQTLRASYAEAQGKYLFVSENSQGMNPPGGFFWTVHKETGECKFESLERENWTPESRFPRSFAPIKGYRKIEVRE